MRHNPYFKSYHFDQKVRIINWYTHKLSQKVSIIANNKEEKEEISQEYCCEFEASLNYIMNLRPAWTTE